MKVKAISFIALLLFSLACSAKTNFSNIIVFGDSLSDTGNFPELDLVYVPGKPHDLTGLDQVFYVPISNPVNPTGYSVPLSTLFPQVQCKIYRWPQDVHNNVWYLTPQRRIEGAERQHRSLIWPQFFLSYAYQDNETRSEHIIPWAQLDLISGYSAQLNDSINYAWADALSINGCSDYMWQPTNICSQGEILDARNDYLLHELNAKHQMIIPGVQKQVEYFIGDVKSSKIKVNDDSIYFIWIGGNDLLANYLKLMHENIFKKYEAIQAFLYQIAWNNLEAMKLLATEPEAHLKHLYVINLFEQDIAPRLHYMPIAARLFADYLTQKYNATLAANVELFHQLRPDVSVHIVPAHDWIKAMASGKPPWNKVFDSDKISNACEIDHLEYVENPLSPLQNCKGYIYWNQVHPAMPFEQVFGYQVYDFVKRTYNKFTLAAPGFGVKAPMGEKEQQAWLKQKIAAIVR